MIQLITGLAAVMCSSHCVPCYNVMLEYHNKSVKYILLVLLAYLCVYVAQAMVECHVVSLYDTQP